MVQFFRAGFQVSERRACRVAAVPAHDDALSQPSAGSIAVAATHQGVGGGAGALWLSAHCTSCCGGRDGG